MDNQNIIQRSIHKCTSAVHRHLMFFLTVGVITLLGFIFYCSIRNQIPTTMNVNEWKNVSKAWVKHGDQRLSTNRVAIVTALFIPQIVIGAPFLNFTKILCGYWFGWLTGFILCSIEEILLSLFSALLFLRLIDTKNMADDITPYLKNSHTWLNLFLLHMSSMPMHLKITLLTCNHISHYRFWTMYIVVASLLTCKNVIIGNLLYHNKYVWIAISIALILSVIPTIIFIYITIHNGLYNSILDFLLNRPNGEEKASIFTIDSDTDSNHDLENWRVDGDF